VNFCIDESRLSDAAVFNMQRNDVIELRDWLTGLLGEADPAPAPLTAADVRAIASEVVAEAVAQREAPEIRNDAEFCRIPGCTLFPGTAEHFEHDPGPCGDCLRGVHPHVFRPCGEPGCQCPEFRDPEPGDVGHPRPPVTLADALADPTPVSLDLLWSPPVVITPECGLCKAPWSDGHGQPGDPCTGAPKQLVGCTCGHSWRVHKGEGCVARVASEYNGYCPCECTPPSAPEVQR